MSQSIQLYNIPPSFYSQVARLALCEAGIEWQNRWIMAGPPSCENYEPWYMRINPNGTVPALVVGTKSEISSKSESHTLIDSFDIIRFAQDCSSNQPLCTSSLNLACADVGDWVARYRTISLRVVSYGRLRRLGTFMNRLRLNALRHHLKACSDIQLKRAYEDKITDIESFMRDAADKECVRHEITQANGWLDQLDQLLGNQSYIAGAQYTLADLVWTVTVARFQMIGLDPLTNRPNLKGWFAAMRQRPSYDAASIWDRPRPGQVLPVILHKFWLKWLLWLGLIAGLVVFLLCVI